MITTAQFVRANAKVEKIMDSACPPEWTISSQAAQEWVEGSTTNAYDPDRIMERHERVGGGIINLCFIAQNKGETVTSKFEISKEELSEIYLSRLSLTKTAEHYGVSLATIRNRLREYGIKERGTPRKITHEQELEIAEMARSGLPAKVAMEKFGLSHPWVMRIARKHWGTFKNSYHTGVATDRAGYILIKCPYHPFANSGGYVPEHRLVMEKKLVRFLTKEEVVHHIDRNKKNNSPENLMLFKNHSAHKQHHQMEDRINFRPLPPYDVVSSADESGRSHG